MEQDVKVFASDITRGICGEKNNLYELLNIEPAKPIKLNEVPKCCTFQPKSDKYYECKKKSRLKVKTVRDIRNLFEKDIDEYLPQSLEKQQNVLLKRIRNGCCKDEETKKLALNILKSDTPILRTSWQMLTNINPEEHIHSIQYILWNGNNIRICGSRGGPNKFIYKLNRHNMKEQAKNKKYRKVIGSKKKGLLQHSLSLKIKPGPLTQKRNIDDSYQKHHVGNLELVNLPKPGLDVMPLYGSFMEPTIRNFIHSLRDVDGIISHKWAEFAVSMVGTLNNSNAVQVQPNACTTFELNYKYDQKRMLMRRDIENFIEKTQDMNEVCQALSIKEFDILEEVQEVLSQIINSVEISLNQDTMFAGEDESRTTNDEIGNITNGNINNSKDKNKKKFGELGRLDVTVIRLPENIENKPKICTNAHCVLGCICDSLNCAVIVKEHCGRLECMFLCKCDFSSYRDIDNYDSVSSNLIPGLLKLDKEMNSNLSREEQKFHQTVVLSGDKSIILKSRRRNWKASTKYSEFYKTMTLKNCQKVDRDILVVLTKINCDNVEPWCMVHKLYKCFCKGQFVHSVGEMDVKHFEAPVSTVIECEKIINSASNIKSNLSNMQTRPQRDKYFYKSERNEKRKFDTLPTLDSEREKIIDLESNVKSNRSDTRALRYREKPTCKSDRKEKRQSDQLLLETYSIPIDSDGSVESNHCRSTCARLQAYVGRKYTNRYYQKMNCKIQEMEKDDQNLHKKLKSLISIDQASSKNIHASERKDALSRKESYCNEKRGIREINEDVNILHKVMKKSVASAVSGYVEGTIREDTPETNVDNIRENIFSSGFTTNDIEESNKGKLVAWLEHSYKQYKKRCDFGLTKLTLQAPQPKKMTLLPWNFILERYKERKNLFLVTKHKPFRMFMAVNRDHPFLQDCINIDDIRFADLYTYPLTVKKLITNATDLKDSFCILCGHAYCWELIGSVTKVDDPTNKETLTCDESICLTNDKPTDYICNENSRTESEPPMSTDEDTTETNEPELDQTTPIDSMCPIREPDTQSVLTQNEITIESSKWFVMTIEKDFSEIQFYNRGFFVKYESIIKAINIARLSQKTVRLSSQKCAESSTNSQFGIYAIPNANEDCVFVGPYESHETLGIETIRSISCKSQQRRTRGYWITTNKIDNMNVIDNPMSFMPTKEIQPNEILSLQSKPNEKKDSFSCIEEEESNESDTYSPSKEKPKIVKPIKISKNNSFYSITKNNLIRLPIHVQKKRESIPYKNNTENTIQRATSAKIRSVAFSDLLAKCAPSKDPDFEDDENMLGKDDCTPEENMFSILKPEEIKSNQSSSSDFLLKLNAYKSNETDGLSKTSDEGESIKTQFDPESKDDLNVMSNTNKRDYRPEGSMFAILKPEEINKRIINNNIAIQPDDKTNEEEERQENLNDTDQEVEKDIEKFFDNPISSVRDLDHNVFVISDDDEECADKETSADDVSSVWIECKNIKKFGWILGLRHNKKNLLSFQFPGFNFSPYYPESLAFNKINEILSRKICIYPKMQIEWNIVTQKRNLKAPKKLRTNDLGAHLVLTKNGPRLKQDVMRNSLLKKTKSKELKSAETASVSDQETTQFSKEMLQAFSARCLNVVR